MRRLIARRIHLNSLSESNSHFAMLIPTDIAHQILATFGITKPTPAYTRLMRGDGVMLNDFDEILFGSPFVFTIDWRSSLHDELPSIVDAMNKIDINASLSLDGDDGTDATITSDSDTQLHYAASENADFTDVIRSLQSVVSPTASFRISPSNVGSDTWIFALLPNDEWAELDSIAPDVIRHFFVPLSQDVV